MKVLPPEEKKTNGPTINTNYKGNLPSQKYFTPKELNALT
eukprot:CAMPEP_0170560382 /NCGR_PEP_ID=MMETSP0211-20121228/48603_1 /TAXON_ID=311385 /ORGANISM="Pseudokeronopsis sp., Strain OXSARD2" /LENGTH=39 /DNA_ID= /DNA_START= /DNA_END= /DNA_ORIENTATION=